MTAQDRFADEHSPRPLINSEVVHRGKIWNVIRDKFRLTEGSEPLVREYLRHPGAVAIVALNDAGQVLLLRQYRQPPRMNLWEIPAGLLDVGGEAPHSAAMRELAEEADLVARDWAVLVDIFLSPGSSSEAMRIYLARGLSDVPPDERHTRTGEEAEIVPRWVDLEEAVDAVLQGRMHSPSAAAGVMAAAHAARGGFTSLRPLDAPWPGRRTEDPAGPGED